MSRIIFCCVIIIACSLPALAQKEASVLLDFSAARAAHHDQQYAKAAAFAAAHNIPSSFTDSKGTHIRISGVNDKGLAVYRSTLNAEAAVTTGTVQLQQGGTLGLNVMGEGMLIGVWDGGIVKDHIELGQRVISKQGLTEDTHATHVTGTLIATGINPAAKGMAPLAKATTWYFDNDEAEMATLAKPDQSSLLVSNHSYGTVTGWFKNNGAWEWTGDDSISPIEDYRFGFYGERAQVFDQLASMAPYYTIVWAAGNDRADVGDGSKPVDCNSGTGYDCIIPESVAKNIITVGAVNEVLTYNGPFSVAMSFFSSWGPTDDGRIKPDLVGDGVNVFSLSAAGTNTYTTLTGTSMSTPNVAGSLLLLQELYSRLHGGNFMKSATLKALAIHTTKEAGNFPGPDYSFGWGLLDAAASAKVLLAADDKNVFIRQLTLSSGQQYELDLNPQANQKITATIAWTDPAATPVAPSLDPANLMLVNDLDLRIADDQGGEQLPWTLDPANPSQQATTGDNFRDNVEKLEFNFPEGKAYKLLVTNKGTLAGGSQDFSLIVTYQSTTPAQTLYWVGGSGDWSDVTHWSASSGGASAQAIPTADDRVIVNENSLDSLGNNIISISQNATCSSLIWMSDVPGSLGLNHNTLTVGQGLAIGSPSFSISTPGTIHLSSGTGSGSFNAKQGNLSGATLIADGDWDVAGNFSADELQLSSGAVRISNCTMSLERLTSSTSAAKELFLTASKIDLSAASTLDGTFLTMMSDHSSLTISAPAVLQWLAIDFPGEIIVPPVITLTVNGNNHIGKILVDGAIQFNGSNRIDTLTVNPGAGIDLAATTVQTLSSQTAIQGNPGQVVTLSSPSGSTLQFTGHSRFCFDYLNVVNVGVSGAIVNAGVNSTLTNAANWQQKNCSDILFADFDVRYPCANGRTEFISTSSGHIVQRMWKVGSIVLADSAYTFANPGDYDVTLIIADNTNKDSVIKNIQILPNTLPLNQVVVGSQALTSFDEAVQYQWYENDATIPGETGRSYSYLGRGGVYFVVTFDGQCDLVSSPFAVTAVSERGGVEVYPNPASDFIRIVSSGDAIGTISLVDMLGREVVRLETDQQEVTLATGTISGGIYVLRRSSAGVETSRKVIIRP